MTVNLIVILLSWHAIIYKNIPLFTVTNNMFCLFTEAMIRINCYKNKKVTSYHISVQCDIEMLQPTKVNLI
jgi:hypothetical protein